MFDKSQAYLTNEGEVVCRPCHAHDTVAVTARTLPTPPRTCLDCETVESAICIDAIQHSVRRIVPLGKTLVYRCGRCGLRLPIRNGGRSALANTGLVLTAFYLWSSVLVTSPLGVLLVQLLVVQLVFLVQDLMNRARFPLPPPRED
ncbi:MAG: hypothetical protein EOP08_06385 [Proteobacteria bacterium]|nr:MAG: hypothetical protein EOP08_06385 [Pseudomonadota bacterium]